MSEASASPLQFAIKPLIYIAFQNMARRLLYLLQVDDLGLLTALMTKGVLVTAILVATIIPMIAQGADDDNKAGAAHAPAAWASMDANSDGVLTRDEVASTLWAQRFDQMDANGDGQVTEQEFSKYRQRVDRRQNAEDS
ncbi:hypothetical protein V5738_14000 [Salinisphaera sp. SPP-AMP-43]|uniref:hypothetical protein n=1 Tax=Salinisphaera sp. SPP-AMP-43 TaxID=3121288 RepID=UPI003C6E6DA8